MLNAGMECLTSAAAHMRRRTIRSPKHMKPSIDLDALTPALTAVADYLACEAFTSTSATYTEQVQALARALQTLPPTAAADFNMTTAIRMMQAMIIARDACERRQQRVEERALKHLESEKVAEAIEAAKKADAEAEGWKYTISGSTTRN